MGLSARVSGVLLSPRDTYAAIVAHPRSFGVLVLVVLLIAGAQFGFLSTSTGRDLMVGQILDQQVRAIERSGTAVSDEMYARMESTMSAFVYVIPISSVVSIPVATAIVAALLTGFFSALLGGSGTFKQVFAVVSHASVIAALQALFTTGLSLASGRLAGANLGIFFPMLEDTSFVYRFFETIDLFFVWSTLSMAIGLAVLYKRRTGPIATAFFAVYAVVAVVIAYFRSGS
jgi:hypothetical protein